MFRENLSQKEFGKNVCLVKFEKREFVISFLCVLNIRTRSKDVLCHFYEI